MKINFGKKNSRSRSTTIDQFEFERIKEATGFIKKPSPYFKLLKNRNFLFLWLGQSISNTGDWVIVAAQIALVASVSESASALAGLMICKLLPAVLLSSLVGVLVDRLNRKTIMITCDILRAVFVLFLPFAHSLYQIYILVFLMDSFSLFFMPAKDASLPNIVSKDEILAANSFSFVTNQITMVLGLAVGATILTIVDLVVKVLKVEAVIHRLFFLRLFAPKFLGTNAVFLIDTFSFMISALTLAFIYLPPSEHVLKKIKYDQIKEDIVEGFSFLKGNPAIRSMIVSVGIAIVGAGTLYTVGYLYLKQIIGVSRSGFGFILTLFAMGLLLGAFLVGFLNRFFPKGGIFVAAIFLFGVSLCLFASFSHFELTLLLAILAGTALGLLSVVGYTVLQESVTDKIRGRVFVALESVLKVSLLFSLAVTGVIADIIGRRQLNIAGVAVSLNGSQTTLFLGGVVVFLAGLVAYRSIILKGAPASG